MKLQQEYLKFYNENEHCIHYYLINENSKEIEEDLKNKKLNHLVAPLSLRFAHPVPNPAKLVEFMEQLSLDNETQISKDKRITFIQHQNYDDFINALIENN